MHANDQFLASYASHRDDRDHIAFIGCSAYCYLNTSPHIESSSVSYPFSRRAVSSMSSSTKKALTTVYPALRRGIQNVQRDVFGQYPQFNGQTGHQMNKTQLKAVYLEQYYMEPIEKFARMVRS
jgi:hypothetical protein